VQLLIIESALVFAGYATLGQYLGLRTPPKPPQFSPAFTPRHRLPGGPQGRRYDCPRADNR
jgi:hypothetical protein